MTNSVPDEIVVEQTTTRIVLAERCPACDGDGVLPSTPWLEFDAAMRAAREAGTLPTDANYGPEYEAAASAWWAAQGFDWGTDDKPSRLPEDEQPCDECDGAGMRLTVAGQQLAAFMLRVFPQLRR